MLGQDSWRHLVKEDNNYVVACSNMDVFWDSFPVDCITYPARKGAYESLVSTRVLVNCLRVFSLGIDNDLYTCHVSPAR